MNLWLLPRLPALATGIVLLTFLFGALLFDTRLSFATDDSTYIANAISVLTNNSYPTYHGSLWPFMLAILIKLFGVKLMLFKFFSFFCMLLQQVVLYFTLRRRVAPIYTLIAMATFAVNGYILAYGSSTFSESFFMLVQTLSFWAFFRLADRLNITVQEGRGNVSAREKRNSRAAAAWAVFGFVFLMLSITKNVALFAAPCFMLWFALRKEWKNLVFAVLVFAAFKVSYEMTVRAVYGNVTSGQIEQLINKKHDDPAQGRENVGGFIDRYITNYGQYVSIHIYKALGLRGRDISTPLLFSPDKMAELNPQTALKPNAALGLLFLALYALALWMSFKHNKYIFYILLYMAALSNITFLIQTYWNQDRYMIIFLPFLLMSLIYGIMELGRERKMPALRLGGLGLAIVILLLQVGPMLSAARKVRGGFTAALGGDLYKNYEQPYKDYLETAAWAGKALPADAIVGTSRNREAAVMAGNLNYSKVNLSFLNNPQMQNADSIVAQLRTQRINYLLTDDKGLGFPEQIAEALLQDSLPRVRRVAGTPNNEVRLYEIIGTK